MKYLKKYQIFESHIQNPAHYISKMGTTINDIKEIFLPLTDLGCKLTYKMTFKDSFGRTKNLKSTRYETPILKIFLKTNKVRYVGGSRKFDNMDYIDALYHTLTRFSDTYKSKLKKLTYELDSRAELTINCHFETEVDETKLDITPDDLVSYMERALDELPDNYGYTRSDDYRNNFFYINLEEESRVVADKMMIELSKNDETFMTNYEEMKKELDDTIKRFEKITREMTGEDIRYVEYKKSMNADGLYLFEGGKQSYQICEISAYLDESRHWGGRVKTGFMKRKDVDVEVYYKSKIRISLK